MRWNIAAFTLILSLHGISAVAASNISAAITPEEVSVKEKDPFTLTCEVSIDIEGSAESVNDSTTLLYHWEKDGAPVFNGSQEFSVLRASNGDSGVYVCIVNIDGIIITSGNATVTVHNSERLNTYIIVLAASIPAVGVVLLLLLCIGLYHWCLSRRRRKTAEKSSPGGEGNRHIHPKKVPAKLSPSVPRHLAKKDRSKSKSLSQLLQASLPLESNLYNSETNLLAVSQPTHLTDVEDLSTVDDLGLLDETLFEHGAGGGAVIDGKSKKHPLNKRAEGGGGRMKRRRASDGTLVIPNSVHQRSRSLKSILKESGSVTDNLNADQRRGSSIASNLSSEATHSDDNSLNLRKSVRFNVEDWANDSGIHTGNSTPHYSSDRRASEPERLNYRLANSERRGSAPGDLVTQQGSSLLTGGGGEVDEGLANGYSKGEWRHNFDFEKEQVEKRFEGIFPLQKAPTGDRTDEREVVPARKRESSEYIANRVAQLYSAAAAQHQSQQPHEGENSSHPLSASTTAISVAEVKKRLLEQGGGRGGGDQQQQSPTSTTEQDRGEGGRRPSVSKLVKERAEMFKDRKINLKTASLDRAQIKRGKPLDISKYVPQLDQQTELLKTKTKPGSKRITTTKKSTAEEREEMRNGTSESSCVQNEPPQMPPPAIPVFSGPSSLSNWVPSCLQGAVISPYYSYEDEDDESTNKMSDEDEGSNSYDDEMMEPSEPTLAHNTSLVSTGPPPLPTFGGFGTSMTPIGRSWFNSSPSKTFGLPFNKLSLSKPLMPGTGGGREASSPFNESMNTFSSSSSSQRGGHRLVVMNRLTMIPEETASASCSLTNIVHT